MEFFDRLRMSGGGLSFFDRLRMSVMKGSG
jgi:hypothetical protein